MCMVALGVIQQYYIYLKTAIFFNKKVVTLLYLWLAAALAAWYNKAMDKQMTISAFSDELAQVRTKKKEFLSQI